MKYIHRGCGCEVTFFQGQSFCSETGKEIFQFLIDEVEDDNQ
jgi:hypothetical protein